MKELMNLNKKNIEEEIDFLEHCFSHTVTALNVNVKLRDKYNEIINTLKDKEKQEEYKKKLEDVNKDIDYYQKSLDYINKRLEELEGE